MFDIGFPELLLVAVVMLLVIGPERLPEALRGIGLWLGRFRRSFLDVKSELEKEIGMDEVRRQLHNEAVIDEIKRIEKQVKQTAELAGSAPNVAKSDISKSDTALPESSMPGLSMPESSMPESSMSESPESDNAKPGIALTTGTAQTDRSNSAGNQEDNATPASSENGAEQPDSDNGRDTRPATRLTGTASADNHNG